MDPVSLWPGLSISILLRRLLWWVLWMLGIATYTSSDASGKRHVPVLFLWERSVAGVVHGSIGVLIFLVVLTGDCIGRLNTSCAQMASIVLGLDMLVTSRDSIAGMFTINPLTVVLRLHCLDIFAPLGRSMRVGGRSPSMTCIGNAVLGLGLFVLGGSVVALTAAAATAVTSVPLFLGVPS